MEVELQRAVPEDGPKLYQMQKRAFQSLLDRYQDWDTSPAAETLERTLDRLREENADFYFILVHGRKAGGLRVVRLPEHHRLSMVFVLPEYRGNGCAQRSLEKVESLYPQADRWTLDTIKQEPGLCRLYEKLGYRRTGEEREIKAGMTLVCYEKIKKR